MKSVREEEIEGGALLVPMICEIREKLSNGGRCDSERTAVAAS